MGYWRFDEDTGGTAYDTATGGSTADSGTLTNSPTWTTGKIGNALQFNGSSNYVSVNNSSDLQFSSNAISIACWAKSASQYNWGNTTGSGDGMFVSEANSFSLGASDQTSTNVTFTAYIGGTAYTSPSHRRASTPGITTWRRITAATMSLSVNGGTATTATHSGTLSSSTSAVYIGSSRRGKLPQRLAGRGAVV